MERALRIIEPLEPHLNFIQEKSPGLLMPQETPHGYFRQQWIAARDAVRDCPPSYRASLPPSAALWSCTFPKC